MTLSITKTKTAGLFIATGLLVLLNTGCNQEEATPVTTDAAPASDATAEITPETIDLTQAPDLFEEPIKPNPLAPQADDVIITVEGTDITHGELMQAVQMTMQQLSRQMPPQQLAQMHGEIYENMKDSLIANALLTKAAEGSSLAVSDEELTAEIAKIQESGPEGSSIEEALAENGVDFTEWKDNLRTQILVGKLVEEKTADAPQASEADVNSFYLENIDAFKTPETVSASHILIAFKEGDTDETKAEKKAKLTALSKQIADGANFEELAAANSDCPSKEQGGSLGSFPRGQMVPEFETAAFALETGAVSDIVATQFGYHLIKVTDHQAAGARSLPEVKDQLTEYLSGQKKQEALMAYISTLREKATIVEHKQDLNAGAK